MTESQKLYKKIIYEILFIYIVLYKRLIDLF